MQWKWKVDFLDGKVSKDRLLQHRHLCWSRQLKDNGRTVFVYFTDIWNLGTFRPHTFAQSPHFGTFRTGLGSSSTIYFSLA